MAVAQSQAGCPNDALIHRYLHIRDRSVALCRTLETEDCVVQTMPDVSPTKWHLAHATWFFETFVLAKHAPTYAVFDPRFAYLFNSYYYTAGEMHARAQRGLLSRPTMEEIINYRRHVDDAVVSLLLNSEDPALEFLITLGLNHEQQHQELLLTDIKHVLWCNPLKPAMRDDLKSIPTATLTPMAFKTVEGGLVDIGADADDSFCFDNETPRHQTLLQTHKIANRLIINSEYRAFVRDGGYQDTALWLSDGWATVNAQQWSRPLYWSEDHEQEFTLGGEQPLDLDAPVCHISFYEADAFARWAGARLPTEAEWEASATKHALRGNFAEHDYWQPVAGKDQWFGDVWEWTASPHAAYPGFKPLAGSLGEYNGKFMCNQMVVRGGSCVSAKNHLRATYRSFFYPDARWQFLGLRLAKDIAR